MNDEFDHQTGDRILQQVAHLATRTNCDADILARYGGEEFIILARATDISGAMKHAERLRRDIEHHSFACGAVSPRVLAWQNSIPGKTISIA